MINKILSNLGIAKKNRHMVTFILICGVILILVKIYNTHKSSTFDFMNPAELNSTDSNQSTGSTPGRLEELLRENDQLQGSKLEPGELSTNTRGLPEDHMEKDTVNPNELLPNHNESTEWAEHHQEPSSLLNNVNLLPAGAHLGINTVGQTLRNANLQLRAEPPNPRANTGPWNQSTILPDGSGVKVC